VLLPALLLPLDGETKGCDDHLYVLGSDHRVFGDRSERREEGIMGPGYVGMERIGAEVSDRAVYYGAVKLVGYEFRECHGHVYIVDAPKKLPENAVGIRVPVGSELQPFLFHAFSTGIPIHVAPAHRYWWDEGALLWTVHAAKT
jgi:hypothetical protein